MPGSHPHNGLGEWSPGASPASLGWLVQGLGVLASSHLRDGKHKPPRGCSDPVCPLPPRTAACSTGRWGHCLPSLTGLSPPPDQQQTPLPSGLRVQGPTGQLQESCPKPRQAQTEKKSDMCEQNHPSLQPSPDALGLMSGAQPPGAGQILAELLSLSWPGWNRHTENLTH